MGKTKLLESAASLPKVEEKYSEEYTVKLQELVTIMNTKMENRDDILAMVGKSNLHMMKDNHSNHARFMESIFYNFDAETLVDTVLWVFRAYIARDFSSTYWSAQLNTWIELYKEKLSPECFNAIYPYYNWMQINIPVFTILAEENIDKGKSIH